MGFIGGKLISKSTPVPIKCSYDAPHSGREVKIRERGTAMSSPLADVFSEVVFFSMDRAIADYAKGANLHRLHDDFWIWGPQDECVKALHAVTESCDGVH